MSTELLALDAFVIALLGADAGLAAAVPGGWHNGQAPQGTPRPYGVIVEQASSDRSSVGAFRRSTAATYLFKIVDGREDYDGIGAAAGIMDGLLQRAHGRQAAVPASGIPTSTVLGVVRTAPYKRAYTTEDGTPMRELGGFYRCWVKQQQQQQQQG